MINLHTEYPYTYININYNDFYYLPAGFNSYAINVYGEVLNLVSLLHIATHICSTGYYTFRVWDRGHTRMFQTHRVLAEIFLPIPNIAVPITNHLNGIKTDNWIENLEWTTYSGNLIHALETGT